MEIIKEELVPNLKNIVYLFLLYYKTTEMKVKYKPFNAQKMSYHSSMTLAWDTYITKFKIDNSQLSLIRYILTRDDESWLHTFRMKPRIEKINQLLEHL